MRPRRVLIAAGGTGGHFYPGFALARAMKSEGWRPLVVLKPGAAAEKLLEAEQIPSTAIDLQGMPRAINLSAFRFGLKLLNSGGAAKRVITDFAPDVVVGMGGYVSFPCLFAARSRAIPSAVHESNAILGLANRACRALGARVFWGLPPISGLKSGETLSGTPIREDLRAIAPKTDACRALGLDPNPSIATLLIFGGSQGAQALNRALPVLLKSIARDANEKNGKNFQVLHISGEKSSAETRALYADAPFKALVLPYLEAMNLGYGAADLAICRAGASTLAELCAQKKPALLIPYPHATAQHQKKNASVLEKIGSARVVEEKEMESSLAPVLKGLLTATESRSKRLEMSANYSRLALPAPQETVAALVRAVSSMARA